MTTSGTAPNREAIKQRYDACRSLVYMTRGRDETSAEADMEWLLAEVDRLQAQVADLEQRLAEATAQLQRQSGVVEMAGSASDAIQSIWAIIDSFDNMFESPTPDQRDVLDALRSVLRHHARLDAAVPTASTKAN